MGQQRGIRVFQTAEHACGYWPERNARDIVLDPSDAALPDVYPQSLALGFRRSGGHVYRPQCAACQACIAVRLPVREFAPDRSQRRCLKRNTDLRMELRPAQRTDEVFDLYRRYVDSRHAGGGMDGAATEDFDRFVSCEWSPTHFLEFRRGQALLAVAVTDFLPAALSSVYTFFDPREAARSLGTFAILSQIEWARREGREYLYLGFWLKDHPKMHYKENFRPQERLQGRNWVRQA
ncbi:arginyltransferase [Arenimonas sp.]|uniref:arginyltransferase n=1 Tax=Arenimonas sp. TaxID=1872635 RepID=UPI0039E6C018